jgi:hypothetical protein
LTRFGAGAAIILTLAGCASTRFSSGSTGPSVATATAAATASATVEPTARPTPEPAANIQKGRQLVYAWKAQYSSFVSFQVIVELKNVGTGWAELSPFNSDYTVLDKAGGVVTTGSFTYAYPEFVAPGGVAYLANDGYDQNAAIADFAKVEVDGRYDPVDAPTTTFTVSGIRWKADTFQGGLIATGFVTSTTEIDSAAVGVVCLSSGGVPLGVTTTNLVQNLAAGQKKGFETVQGTPPLRASQCAKAIGYASDTGF